MSLMDLGYLAHPEGDKCYQVTNAYHECTVFVWARFHAEARRYGAACTDGEWDDVECERFPELDHFEGDLLSWCLDRGWAFDCSECDQRIGMPQAYRDGDDVFCSMEHAVKYRAHWARVHALEARFLAYAQATFPEENPRRAHCNVEGDGIISTDRGCRIIARSAIDVPA